MKKNFLLIISFFFICLNAQAGLLNFYTLRMLCNYKVLDRNSNTIEKKEMDKLIPLDFFFSGPELIGIYCTDLNIHIDKFNGKFYHNYKKMESKTQEGKSYISHLFYYVITDCFALSYVRASLEFIVTPFITLSTSDEQHSYIFDVFSIQDYNKTEDKWETLQYPFSVKLAEDLIFTKLEKWSTTKQQFID